mmetsp:Transcript_22432/g.52901  ORF Transcript_22432/g.52901 Transcript_22432/m.52901 type:complete len:110 (+) Transcript_22432:2534-2863(+)
MRGAAAIIWMMLKKAQGPFSDRICWQRCSHPLDLDLDAVANLPLTDMLVRADEMPSTRTATWAEFPRDVPSELRLDAPDDTILTGLEVTPPAREMGLNLKWLSSWIFSG